MLAKLTLFAQSAERQRRRMAPMIQRVSLGILFVVLIHFVASAAAATSLSDALVSTKVQIPSNMTAAI